MSPGQGDPLVMEMTRGLDGGRSVAEQDGVARETKDTIRPAVGSDHVDALGSSKMTIAADQNMGVGPVAPQIRQQPDKIIAFSVPVGRMPGRRVAMTRA